MRSVYKAKPSCHSVTNKYQKVLYHPGNKHAATRSNSPEKLQNKSFADLTLENRYNEIIAHIATTIVLLKKENAEKATKLTKPQTGCKNTAWLLGKNSPGLLKSGSTFIVSSAGNALPAPSPSKSCEHRQAALKQIIQHRVIKDNSKRKQTKERPSETTEFEPTLDISKKN